MTLGTPLHTPWTHPAQGHQATDAQSSIDCTIVERLAAAHAAAGFILPQCIPTVVLQLMTIFRGQIGHWQ